VPRKRFGQHFLIDQSVLQRIVDVVSLQENQIVVEIGPGTGLLTDALLQRVSSLIAIEIDRDLVNRLIKKYPENQLTVVQADILQFDFLSLIAHHKQKEKLILVGNLPYNISTPLIFHLIKFVDIIYYMVFMVQKETALRLSASPGSKHYGRLSVMTALDLECKLLFDVPPKAFNPPPKVYSTAIKITPRLLFNTGTINRKRVNQIVLSAFAQRRKTIRNSLKSLFKEEQIASLGIDPGQRAENLSVWEFIHLSKAYQQLGTNATTACIKRF